MAACVPATLGAAAGDARSAPSLECALPVVVRAALRDVQESWFNGPEGYAFIVEAGGEKVGTLPLEVGRNPARTFDASVHASNFQGPVLVRHPDLRPQWEWTADGESQLSAREYPLLAARACAGGADELPRVTLHVAEHDEWPWRDDPLGAFTVDLGRCRQAARGGAWTAVLRAAGEPYAPGGSNDIEFVDYVVWCFPCPGGSPCDDGIRWPEP